MGDRTQIKVFIIIASILLLCSCNIFSNKAEDSNPKSIELVDSSAIRKSVILTEIKCAMDSIGFRPNDNIKEYLFDNNIVLKPLSTTRKKYRNIETLHNLKRWKKTKLYPVENGDILYPHKYVDSFVVNLLKKLKYTGYLYHIRITNSFYYENYPNYTEYSLIIDSEIYPILAYYYNLK